jgi:hypothetical protein
MAQTGVQEVAQLKEVLAGNKGVSFVVLNLKECGWQGAIAQRILAIGNGRF